MGGGITWLHVVTLVVFRRMKPQHLFPVEFVAGYFVWNGLISKKMKKAGFVRIVRKIRNMGNNNYAN